MVTYALPARPCYLHCNELVRTKYMVLFHCFTGGSFCTANRFGSLLQRDLTRLNFPKAICSPALREADCFFSVLLNVTGTGTDFGITPFLRLYITVSLFKTNIRSSKSEIQISGGLGGFGGFGGFQMKF